MIHPHILYTCKEGVLGLKVYYMCIRTHLFDQQAVKSISKLH